MVVFVPYVFLLFDTFVVESVSVADICLVIFIMMSLYKQYYKSKDFNIGADGTFLFLYLLWLLFSFLFIISSREYVDNFSFWNNFIRLFVYFLSVILLPKFIVYNRGLRVIMEGIRNVILVVLFIAFVEYLLIYMGQHVDFRFTFTEYRRYFEHIRVKAIFREPSFYTIFLGVFISLMIAGYRRGYVIKYYNFTLFLGCIGLLISMSFVGYMILLVIMINILFEKSNNGAWHLKVFTLVGVVLFISLLYNDKNFKENIIYRIKDVISMSDGSSLHRTGGQIEVAYATINDSFYAGRGLGQITSYYRYDPRYFIYEMYNTVNDSPGINNILVSVIVEGGVVGLSLFVLFLCYLIKKDVLLWSILIVVMLGWGVFISTLMWFYYIMSKTFYLNDVVGENA